jgi:hypothetical protein
MSALTLELPETLHHQLEDLAESEGIQLQQYILYVLTRQIASAYTAQVVSEEAVVRQETAFATLLQRLGKASPSDMEQVFTEREVVEPESDLSPETVKRLREQIVEKQDAKLLNQIKSN